MPEVKGKKTVDRAVYKTVGCYGHGANAGKVETKDGKLMRVRPLEFYEKYTPEEIRSWELNVSGKTFKPGDKFPLPAMPYGWKSRVYSKNRVPYPLKRVDWEPGGDPEKINAQNRGISKYERISWDEATTIVANEITRIGEKYGIPAILCQADGHGQEKNLHGRHGCMTRLMKHMGDYTLQARQPDSWEGWYWGAKHVWGMDPLGKQTHIQNCFKDICENSNAVLFWGCDVLTTAATQAGMFPSRMEYFWSELGIKQIYICPDVNYAAAVHADKWFPVLPNTDAALQLAIAYTWIVEGTYDKDYLDTHAVGVDNFFNYVLGGEDGVAKTPKWAEEKCGIPSRQIKALARYWAKSNVCTAHCNGGSFIRSCYSHEPARLEVILLAMQALGHPGRNQMSMMEWGIHSKDTAKPIALSEYNINFGSIWPGEYYGQVTKNFIPKTMIPEALMLQEGEKLDWYGHVNSGFPRADQFSHFEFPNPDGGKNIHMVWSDAPCWSTCWNNGFKLQDCWRNPAIETFVVEHPWLENDACYADLILPVTTLMEDDDIVTSGQTGDYDVALAAQKAVDTVGEAMGDFDIVLLIADKLGKREAVLRELCKFDDDVDVNAEIGEDYVGYLRRFAWDHCWSDLNMSEPMTFEEFEEKGYFVVPAKEGWEDARPGLIDFYEDPENNPLLTPTGKLEFYSTGIAKFFPDDEIRSPVPKWIEEDDCHHERLTCDRGQDYPFLLVSNHPHFRFHAQYDDCIWFREIPMCKVDGPDGYKYEPVWVNTIDARNLGLKNGDIVKLFNERGGVLGGVIVTERVPRHTLLQDHGSRVDAIIPGEGGLDRGGANNLICPYNTSSKNAVGEVTSGFLVGIEKVDVFELAKQYPDAFNKDYAPEDGIHVSNYIVEKEA